MTSGWVEFEHLLLRDERTANQQKLDRDGSGDGLTPQPEPGREQGSAPTAVAGLSAPPDAPRRPADPPTAARPLRPPGPGPSGGRSDAPGASA